MNTVARRTLTTVIKSVVALVSHASWRLLVRISPTKRLRDLEVVFLYDDERRVDVLQKLDEALELIARHQNRRWRRIRADMPRILVSDVVGPEFIPSIHACLLSIPQILEVTPIKLALVIVHESAHARLCRARVASNAKRRDRIERLCMRAEEEFASVLPESDAALAIVHGKMRGAPWWTDDAIIPRRQRELRALGMPGWFVRSMLRLRQMTRE